MFLYKTAARAIVYQFFFVRHLLTSHFKMNAEKRYFKIFGEQSRKVLDASQSNPGEVILWEANDGDNQLWYWDGIDRDILRNKMYPDKVISITII